jgi:hypothetical protein
MKISVGNVSLDASQEEISKLRKPLTKLLRQHGLKAAAFFGAWVVFMAYLDAPAARKDQAAQNPNCRILIYSLDSSYTNNGQVLGPGACMNSQGDRFDGNGSIAGKPN